MRPTKAPLRPDPRVWPGPMGCLLDEPWPDDPMVKRREEEVSDAGRLKSVNVSRLLWVSQLNGALEPGVNVHGDMGE